MDGFGARPAIGYRLCHGLMLQGLDATQHQCITYFCVGARAIAVVRLVVAASLQKLWVARSGEGLLAGGDTET